MSDTDKRCFCISAKNGDMDAIVKHLKNNTIIDDDLVPMPMDMGDLMPYDQSLGNLIPVKKVNNSSIKNITKVPFDKGFMSSHIGKITDEDDKVLKLLDSLMGTAIKKIDDTIRPVTEPINIINKDSLTTSITNDDDFDLNKLASTNNTNYRSVDNMGIFEDFGCANKCSSNNHGNREMSLFDSIETKYLLFIIALLLLCSVIFHK